MTQPFVAADKDLPIRFGERLHSALQLLGARQRIVFAMLIAERIAVGLCDLLLAGAMYLFFLLLQGGVSAHHHWWMPKTVLVAALTTSALVVLRVVLDLLSTRAVVGYIQSLYSDILLRLTYGYSEMLWSRFVMRNRSELLKYASVTAMDAANFYHLYIEMTAAVTVVALMTVAVVYQNPEAACGLGTAVVLLYGVHRYLLRNKLRLAASNREQSLRLLQRNLSDMFSSGKEIRTYGNQSFFHDRIGEEVGRLRASNLRLALLPQISRILADQGVVLLFLFVVIVVQLGHGDVRQLLSLLVFYFVLSRRLLPLIGQIALMAGLTEGSYDSLQAINRELSDCLLHRKLTPEIRLPSIGVVVELVQVSFFFDEGEQILRDVTLYLRHGERIVVRGVSGSGKSTLLNIIAGILQPASGTVRVDRKSVAYVPQEIALLDDSIRNNLLFGLPKKSDDELMNALAVARLSEFVSEQPQGLETRVGDNGVLFSGGERQRLGLARAILRGVTLLLLDESTSALDYENERELLGNLKSSEITVLLVSHRLHAVGFADRVLLLREGRLIEESDYVASMTKDGSMP
ncbi:ATP-binding cassette domain-containing protein [Acidicapsa acidisoli]|uniref:ATP-binding cassette domain-containing protein n=1 Tax=Acidicapsa acidisoli TaxID=1615681 RepID=UPI0021E03BD5|nr:ABC transporter ATP-binding protein [Acidicapsa acidisoli]